MEKRDDNIIFGLNPIKEALKTKKDFDKIFIQRGIRNERITELQNTINKLKIPLAHVPIQKLNKLTNGNHQGIVGLISPIEFQNIETLVTELFKQNIPPFILILDRVTDVRNFGGICRTAECAGVNAIVIPKKESVRINGDAVRTSAGAIYNVPICKVDNLADTVIFLQASNIKIVGCTEKGKDLIYDLNDQPPLAVVMGNEEKGISNQILKFCDHKVRIPMHGKTSSLNVSVATGIVLFEVAKKLP